MIQACQEPISSCNWLIGLLACLIRLLCLGSFVRSLHLSFKFYLVCLMLYWQQSFVGLLRVSNWIGLVIIVKVVFLLLHSVLVKLQKCLVVHSNGSTAVITDSTQPVIRETPHVTYSTQWTHCTGWRCSEDAPMWGINSRLSTELTRVSRPVAFNDVAPCVNLHSCYCLIFSGNDSQILVAV